MELPSKLKKLYRHWKSHTKPAEVTDEAKIPKKMKWFVRERVEIWKKKTEGAEPPYTSDPILSKYRFCNIFREFDRQTIEYHELLNPLRDDFPLWLLNMFYARMVARPETVRKAGLLSFDSRENAEVYERLLAMPRPKYGTPYVFPISAIQRSATPTRELFLTTYLPGRIPAVAKEIETLQKESVYDGVARVLTIFGFNLEFLWTEVLIDTAYQFPERLDLFARFPIGPGSRPTFEAIAPGQDPSLVVPELAKYAFDVGVTYKDKSLRLSAENWEGVGCEYRKYTNLDAGHGRKRLYA